MKMFGSNRSKNGSKGEVDVCDPCDRYEKKKTLLSVNPKIPPWEQSPPLHNRWHPDIPAVAEVKEGEIFRVETVDWTGGQIKNDDSADDVKHVDLTQVHYLSGPIRIPTAVPGDLLKVEFLNLGPLDGDEWGFTGTFHKDNGGGFLTDHYPEAALCSSLFSDFLLSRYSIGSIRIHASF